MPAAHGLHRTNQGRAAQLPGGPAPTNRTGNGAGSLTLRTAFDTSSFNLHERLQEAQSIGFARPTRSEYYKNN